jgi:predicted dehydrogenase
MIHDLDLVHRLLPEMVGGVSADARALHGEHADEASALLHFRHGTRVRLDASRIAPVRSRGMRVIYDDGLIEVDFLTRKVRNTTPRPLKDLDFDDPLGRSVNGFIRAVAQGDVALVQPEEARQALQTALAIEDAADRMADLREAHALHAAAR